MTGSPRESRTNPRSVPLFATRGGSGTGEAGVGEGGEGEAGRSTVSGVTVAALGAPAGSTDGVARGTTATSARRVGRPPSHHHHPAPPAATTAAPTSTLRVDCTAIERPTPRETAVRPGAPPPPGDIGPPPFAAIDRRRTRRSARA